MVGNVAEALLASVLSVFFDPFGTARRFYYYKLIVFGKDPVFEAGANVYLLTCPFA